MTRPSISIVVTVYNSSSFLLECLSSVRNQSFRDYEVIIVDDGSTDESFEICHYFCLADERFILFKTRNKGVSAARQYGFSKATADYVIFIDSDDFLVKDFLEELFSHARSTQADITVCGFYWWWPFSNNLKAKTIDNSSEVDVREFAKAVYTLGDSTEKCVTGGFLWNKLMKKELLQEVIFPNFSAAEDEALLFKLVSKTKKVCYFGTPLYKYRVRRGSLVGKPNFRLKHVETRRFTYDNSEELVRDIAFAGYVLQVAYSIGCFLTGLEKQTGTLIELKKHSKYIMEKHELLRKEFLGSKYKKVLLLLQIVHVPDFLLALFCKFRLYNLTAPIAQYLKNSI